MNHNSEFLKLVEDALTRVREITAEEVVAKIEAAVAGKPPVIDPISMQPPPQEQAIPFILIDTREESEFASGNIPGSVHLSKGVIECYIEGKIPDKDTALVLYCGGGYRSALAADNLQKMGYKNVYSMKGGWGQWNERGFPINNG